MGENDSGRDTGRGGAGNSGRRSGAGESGTFVETGWTVLVAFLNYWESHDGLAQQSCLSLKRCKRGALRTAEGNAAIVSVLSGASKIVLTRQG
ncbi:MAG: hypothetical protein ABI670_06990 [Chloroflexota bacterium]